MKQTCYLVIVKTSNGPGARTNSNVYLKLMGDDATSATIALVDCLNHRYPFRRGATDVFAFHDQVRSRRVLIVSTSLPLSIALPFSRASENFEHCSFGTTTAPTTGIRNLSMSRTLPRTASICSDAIGGCRNPKEMVRLLSSSPLLESCCGSPDSVTLTPNEKQKILMCVVSHCCFIHEKFFTVQLSFCIAGYRTHNPL